MKITFLSNYFNHHQLPFSDALYSYIGENYSFVETKKMDEDRKNMGWAIEKLPSYVKQEFSVDNKLCLLDDVVIFGSAPRNFIEKRLKNGKIVFFYSERWYKNGFNWLKWPVRFIRHHFMYGRYKNTYLLCASAYAFSDCAKTLLFQKRAYKWGYFPPLKKYDNINELVSHKQKTTILWCGRLLDWKHPDDAIQVAKMLNDIGLDFKMNIIGTGKMMSTLKTMIHHFRLENKVFLLGSMSPDMVRSYMENAGIFIFTSDRCEGWGAVLNEAMNSGCAVVASHAIGSVPYLLKNGENGFIYYSGDKDSLFVKVKRLLKCPNEQDRVGCAAYETIINEWNADVAAERFLNLSQCLLNEKNDVDIYQSGPCSRAEIIRDNWFHE